MAAETDLELHKHLLKLMKFYGEDLDQRAHFISIRKGGFLSRRDLASEAELLSDKNCRGGPQGNRLNVESPLDIQDDVASGAFNYNMVKHHFKLAY